MTQPLFKKNQVVGYDGQYVQVRNVRGDEERDYKGRVVYDVQGFGPGFMAIEEQLRPLTPEEKGQDYCAVCVRRGY